VVTYTCHLMSSEFSFQQIKIKNSPSSWIHTSNDMLVTGMISCTTNRHHITSNHVLMRTVGSVDCGGRTPGLLDGTNRYY
jgi:hypothetical protein